MKETNAEFPQDKPEGMSCIQGSKWHFFSCPPVKDFQSLCSKEHYNVAQETSRKRRELEADTEDMAVENMAAEKTAVEQGSRICI